MAVCLNRLRILLTFIFLISFIAKVAECSLIPTTNDASLELQEKKYRISLPPGYKIPFYGINYSNFWINRNGFISFAEDAQYSEDIGQKTRFLPADKPMAIAYYYDAFQFESEVDLSTTLGTKIFHREIQKARSQEEEIELSDLKSNITEAFVGFGDSDITYGVIITWTNVTNKDEKNRCKSVNECKTSTFQLVMLTDGKKTYFIFNYGSMKIPAETNKVGFNGGYGRGWTPTLSDQQLRDIGNGVRGSDVPGRFYYLLQDEKVTRGGCIQPGISGVSTVSPTYAGMYGGEVIQVSGECLSSTSAPKCQFGGRISVTGYRLNNMKFQCVVPRLTLRGWLDLATSVDGGRSYKNKGQIYIVHPGRMPDLVMFPNGAQGWNQTSASSLTINWDKSKLSSYTNALINITLIGYKETNNGPEYSTLHTIANNVPNSQGSYTFDTSRVFCFGKCDVEIFNVEVSLGNINQAYKYMRMVSNPMPSGWFVNENRIQNYGNAWPTAMCNAWYNTDKQEMQWLTELEYCPCNLWQAISDIGRWQPDVGCDMFHGSKCTYHIGAKHCVRAVQPTKSGSGNQCCYDPDGSLRYAADSYQGSTPDKSHDWGAFPYGMNDKVPVLSHWLKDVVTFYYCCLWTEYKECDKYMDLRATRDCNGYMPPVPAMIYGLAHVATFGGSHFHICAEGDYILAEQPGSFEIQGRFQQILEGQVINSTVTLTNLAVKVNNEVIEVKIKPPRTDRSKRSIDVIVNHQYSFFDDKPIFWKDYKEIAVVNNVEDTKNMQSNVTIILKNGVGVQVAEKEKILEALFMFPASLQGKVNGLLGQLGKQKNMDLVPKGTNISASISNDTQLFNTFQVTWRLNETNLSIIPYRPKQIPFSTCGAHTTHSGDVTFCEGNKECEFDFKRTGSRLIAMESRRSDIRFSQLQTYLKPVRSCGLLNVNKAIRDNHNYSLGSTVTLTGCKNGLTLGGATNKYTCVASGDSNQAWSPEVTSVCRDDLEAADIGMIVGIVLGVLVAVAAVTVLIIYYVRRSGKRKGSREDNDAEFSDKGKEKNPATKQYEARYSEVHKKDDEQGMGQRVPSRELTV